MTRVLFAILLFVTALFQATILPAINPWSVSPDLVLVLLFVWATTHRIRESLAWVFFAGLLLDTVALDPIGTNALALLVVVVLAGAAQRRTFQVSALVPVLLIVVVTVAHGVVLSVLRGAPIGWFILIQALMHAILVPLFYGFAQRRRIRNRGRPVRRSSFQT